MVYDDLDRIRQRVPAPRGLSPSRRAQLGIGTITFHYDGTAGPATNAKGRLSKVVHSVDDPATPTVEALDNDYWYFARGVIQKEQRRIVSSYLRSTSATQWVERTYNALNLETLTTFDDGTKYATTYDARGLVSHVDWRNPTTGLWPIVGEYSYSLAGQPRSRTTHFDQDEQITYDVLGRPFLEIVRDLTPLTTRARREFFFDQAGNILRTDVTNPALSGTWTYTYDRRHRLRTATAPGYTGSFTYSLAGNILTATVTGPVHPRAVTYAYGSVDPQAVDKLTSSGGAIYAQCNYDRAGNTTRRVTPDGTWDLEWDGEDQLREAVGAGQREAYWYDHENQRTLAIRQDATTTEARFWFDASETTFGATTRRWIHMPGARVENNATIELNYADHVASNEVTLDSAGAVVAAFVYTPWGEPLASSGATSTHRRRFNDKDTDLATGLSYYGFRYYDALIGRWVSGDPLFRFAPDLGLLDPDLQNLYAFSLNSGLRYYDPDGRYPGNCFGRSCARVAGESVLRGGAVGAGIDLDKALADEQLAVDSAAMADPTPGSNIASMWISAVRGDVGGVLLSVIAIPLALTGVGDEAAEAAKLGSPSITPQMLLRRRRPPRRVDLKLSSSPRRAPSYRRTRTTTSSEIAVSMGTGCRSTEATRTAKTAPPILTTRLSIRGPMEKGQRTGRHDQRLRTTLMPPTPP